MTQEMHLLGEAIQEMTLYTWDKIYDGNKYDLGSQVTLNIIRDWAEDFENWWQAHTQDWISGHNYNEELEAFADIKIKKFKRQYDPDFKQVTIGFCVTEHGSPISGTLVFPKEDEDMHGGSEYEWYYSLREKTDQILALKVGESMPFKMRDEADSVGSVTRLA